jgi:deazaflavin-dependent oxidoreductase (nitroreductase family)
MAGMLDTIRRVWIGAPAKVLYRMGRVGRLTTTGRRSGQPRSTHVGFITRADGTLLIGAGPARRQWADNLRANPRCSFETRDMPATACIATPVPDARREAVLDEFRQRVGRTRASYRGPLFELRRA